MVHKMQGPGNDKDHCPVFANYLAGGGPIPLRPEAQVIPSATLALWCVICQIGWKNAADNNHLLQKYKQIPTSCSVSFVGRWDRTSARVEVMN